MTGNKIVGAARRAAGMAAGALGITWLVRAAWDIPSALGASMSAIQPYAAGSVSYRNRQFHNTEPSAQFVPGSPLSLANSFLTRRGMGRPPGPIPVFVPVLPVEAAELAVTWFGHATTLIEVDGYRILTDPVWAERVSPSPVIGPVRLHPMPAPISDLPAVDVVVISHDHYDHLDRDSIRALAASQDALFVVPIGIGAHLRHWRVPDHRIVELDWGSSVSLADLGRSRGAGSDLVMTCAEARHFSGRGLVRNTTLWASWSIAGPSRRVYFGGDTGYTKAFTESGVNLGPFDLTLLPIGAYNEHWPDVHMDPEEAVRAHANLCAGDPGHGLFVPIHWATFNLAFHGWSEPVQRLVSAARRAGTEVVVPVPGQRVDVNALPSRDSWWEDAWWEDVRTQ